MRFAMALLVLAVSLSGALQVPVSVAADRVPILAVGLDRVVNIRLWGPASTVVVGNPAIADVNLVNGRSLLITGHAVGQTSIMVLDSSGRETFHQTIVVGAADAGQVSVQRGADVTDYSCSPRCERLVPAQGSAGVAASSDPAP